MKFSPSSRSMGAAVGRIQPSMLSNQSVGLFTEKASLPQRLQGVLE